MKKLLVLLCLLMITSVSALDDLGDYKIFSCVNIRQTCATCSYVNISISYPNSTIVYSDVAMSEQGAGLWTYEFCNTSTLGRYDVLGKGDLDSTDTSFATYFNITPSGFKINTSYYFLILIISGGILALGFSIKDGWVVVLGSFGLVFIGLFTLLYGIDGLRDPVYTWGSSIITLALGGYFGIRASLDKINDN